MEASFPSVDHPVLFRTSFCLETFFFLLLTINYTKPFLAFPHSIRLPALLKAQQLCPRIANLKSGFYVLPIHTDTHIPHAPPPLSQRRVQHELYFPYFIILPSLLCLFHMWCPGRRQTSSSSSSTRYASELQEHGRKPIPDTAADDDYCSAADRARFLQNPAILDTLDSVHRSLLFNNLKFDTGKWWSC